MRVLVVSVGRIRAPLLQVALVDGRSSILMRVVAAECMGRIFLLCEAVGVRRHAIFSPLPVLRVGPVGNS